MTKTRGGAAGFSPAIEFAATARRATGLLCALSICPSGRWQVQMVTLMKVVIEHEGDYFIVEVYNESGQLLIRVGFDRKPTEAEIDAVLEVVEGGDTTCQP